MPVTNLIDKQKAYVSVAKGYLSSVVQS